MSMRIQEVRSCLQRFGIYDVLSFVYPDPSDKDSLLDGAVDILDHFKIVSESAVRNSICCFKRCGQTYSLENLSWSTEFLDKTCEKNLRDKVFEHLLSVPKEERGGLLFFSFF